jgi:hypothetical protein
MTSRNYCRPWINDFLWKLRVEGKLQQSGSDNADEAKSDNGIIKKKRPYNTEEDEDIWNTSAEAEYRFNVSVLIVCYCSAPFL